MQVFLSGDQGWVDICYEANLWMMQTSLVVCRELGYDHVGNTSGENMETYCNIASDTCEITNNSRIQH